MTVCVFMMLPVMFPSDSYSKTYKFFGGPDGGTYQYYAKAIAEMSQKAGVKVKASPSSGSIVNIRVINSGKADFGVAYSGDVFKARNGMLTRDKKKYTDVLAVGYFYSAAAQLVVKADSGITSARQLAGKNVGIGNFGSGAAASCEMFLSQLEIWHQVNKKFLGYSKAADAFKKGQLDAFWVFTGFPNASVKQAAAENSIALINAYNDISETDMLEKHPYLSKITVPSGTYEGVPTDTATFQDCTLWITNSKVPEDDVYKLLSLIFSREGLDHLLKAHKSAKNMSIPNGITGIVTPLHPGAEKFWKEKGVLK